MPVYYLEEHKVRIQVIDLNDALLNIQCSRFLSPKILRAMVLSLENCTMNVAPTLPNVFFYLESGGNYTTTYNLSYRSFLAFVSELVVQEEKDLDWRKCGF